MEKEHDTSTLFWAFVVVALLIGVGGGYFFGYSKGQSDLLVEQESALTAAQEEIVESANPFAETAQNPLEGGYENPFEGANPFAQ